MNSGTAGYIAALIGVPIVFWLLRKRFPSLSKYESSNRPLDGLNKEFGKWYLFSSICTIILAVVTGYIWWLLFKKIGSLSSAGFSDSIFNIVPDGIPWATPAIFCGIGTGGYFADKIIKRILKDRYDGYIAYVNTKFKINTQKLTAPITIFLSVIVLILIVLFLNWHTVFRSNEIIIKPLLSLSEKKFRYSEISSIKTAPALIAPNGKVVSVREYVIRFTNGESWTTSNEPALLSLRQKEEIICFVSRVSGVQVTELEVLNRNDL